MDPSKNCQSKETISIYKLPESVKKKRKMKERYDTESYVNTYDRRYQNLQFGKAELLMPKMQKIEGMLLDFGAGTGLLWDFLQEYKNVDKEEKENRKENIKENKKISETSDYRYLGIDLSRGMLKIFDKKIQELYYNENDNDNKNLNGNAKCHFVCCDGEFLPFRIKKFDQIWALTSLQNLSDITQGLSEIARVRKKNAKIGITYLRKSIAKKDLQKLIQTYLGSVEFIEVDQYDPTAYSEDWICFIYKN